MEEQLRLMSSIVKYCNFLFALLHNSVYFSSNHLDTALVVQPLMLHWWFSLDALSITTAKDFLSTPARLICFRCCAGGSAIDAALVVQPRTFLFLLMFPLPLQLPCNYFQWPLLTPPLALQLPILAIHCFRPSSPTANTYTHLFNPPANATSGPSNYPAVISSRFATTFSLPLFSPFNPHYKQILLPLQPPANTSSGFLKPRKHLFLAVVIASESSHICSRCCTGGSA